MFLSIGEGPGVLIAWSIAADNRVGDVYSGSIQIIPDHTAASPFVSEEFVMRCVGFELEEGSGERFSFYQFGSQG